MVCLNPSKAQNIRRKLGGSASLPDTFPTKPKGMHWTTYLQHREKSDQAASMALGGGWRGDLELLPKKLSSKYLASISTKAYGRFFARWRSRRYHFEKGVMSCFFIEVKADIEYLLYPPIAEVYRGCRFSPLIANTGYSEKSNIRHLWTC